MVWGLITGGISGLLDGVGQAAESGMKIYSGYKNLEMDLFKKSIDIGLDSAQKGMGILNGGLSAYNNWKLGKLKAQREIEHQKKID